MKQKDWFWCGAVLFALAVFVSLQSVQGSLCSCIAGGGCALVSAILFGCGLRADAQEKSAIEAKRTEEEQRQLEAQRQAQRKNIAELLDHLKEYSVSSRIQIKESAKSICDFTLEQHTALRKVLERQGQESTKYHEFMIDQPWNEIDDTLKSIASQVDNILYVVDSIQSDTEKQLKKALDKLKEDSQSLQEKLQYVCETLEKQGKESRDAMDRMMQGYSDVTAQDIEVLTALMRDSRV